MKVILLIIKIKKPKKPKTKETKKTKKQKKQKNKNKKNKKKTKKTKKKHEKKTGWNGGGGWTTYDDKRSELREDAYAARQRWTGDDWPWKKGEWKDGTRRSLHSTRHQKIEEVLEN